MRYSTPTRSSMFLVTVAALLLAGRPVFAEEKASPAGKPGPADATVTMKGFKILLGGESQPPAPARDQATVMQKLKELSAHLVRALDIAVDLLSNNKTDLLSNNRAALLSGNRPEILSENKTKLLSDNQTPILSGNNLLSGNKVEMFSNIKIEIHINQCGNGNAPKAEPPRPPKAEPPQTTKPGGPGPVTAY